MIFQEKIIHTNISNWECFPLQFIYWGSSFFANIINFGKWHTILPSIGNKLSYYKSMKNSVIWNEYSKKKVDINPKNFFILDINLKKHEHHLKISEKLSEKKKMLPIVFYWLDTNLFFKCVTNNIFNFHIDIRFIEILNLIVESSNWKKVDIRIKLKIIDVNWITSAKNILNILLVFVHQNSISTIVLQFCWKTIHNTPFHHGKKSFYGVGKNKTKTYWNYICVNDLKIDKMKSRCAKSSEEKMKSSWKLSRIIFFYGILITIKFIFQWESSISGNENTFIIYCSNDICSAS